MNEWLMPMAAIAIGYVIGSIPFGLILARLGGAGDIRKIGSGNIGATNVLRTGHKGLAAATLLLDAAKGAAAFHITSSLGPDLGLWGALAAFAGHLYPVWLKFAGGKGVATLLGIALVAAWPAGLAFIVAWLTTLAATRYSSISGMVASISTPIVALSTGYWVEAAFLVAMALAVLWNHSDNVERLFEGTEPKVGSPKG
jgi:acyl phosphate:glycerol-3-phosphate acyltransferase